MSYLRCSATVPKACETVSQKPCKALVLSFDKPEGFKCFCLLVL